MFEKVIDMLSKLKKVTVSIDQEFIKFISIGILNNSFSYLLFSIIFFFTASKEFSVGLSYFISISINYFTMSVYVFKIKYSFLKLIYFSIIYVFLITLNLIHLLVTVDIFQLNVYFAQLSTFLYLPLLSYFLNKRYVFNNITYS